MDTQLFAFLKQLWRQWVQSDARELLNWKTDQLGVGSFS